MADVIHSVRDSLRVKINESENYELDNDDEYYFAVGQLVSYLLSKSKASKKPCSLANPFINGKSNDDIKEKLRRLCSKYNYALDYQKEKRFKNLYVMIIGYVPKNKKVNQDLIVGGYLSKSLLYESNKGEEVHG